MNILLLLFSLIFGATATGVTQGYPAPSISPSAGGSASCYQLDVNDTYPLDGSACDSLNNKTYKLIRKDVKIESYKIVEGRKSDNQCSGGQDIRKIKDVDSSTLDEKGDVFWVDENYKGLGSEPNGILQKIILLLDEIPQPQDKAYKFKVYIEQSVVIPDELPEWITNCQETGDLIPIVDEPVNTLPPKAFATYDDIFNQDLNLVFTSSVDITGFKKYHQKIKKDRLPTAALPVGTLTANGTKVYDVYQHLSEAWYLKDTQTGDVYRYNNTDTKPGVQGNSNNSVQLKQLQFMTEVSWTWITPECKPALYFYPEKPLNLSVKVNPKGKITKSIPDHGQEGWQNVLASPDGSLQYQNQTYPYLYYETELNNINPPKNGWIVEKKDLAVFFNYSLPQLGLNKQEVEDFLVYWLPILLPEEKWFIGLISQDELNKIEPLEFSVNPDSLIRVRFYFEKIDGTNIASIINTYRITNWLDRVKLFINKPLRTGFTVVDWGGIVKNGSCNSSVISR